MYDYRHELLEILRHTTSDPASLSQTQRSLTTILRLLNQLQPFDEREEAPLSTAAVITATFTMPTMMGGQSVATNTAAIVSGCASAVTRRQQIQQSR